MIGSFKGVVCLDRIIIKKKHRVQTTKTKINVETTNGSKGTRTRRGNAMQTNLSHKGLQILRKHRPNFFLLNQYKS